MAYAPLAVTTAKQPNALETRELAGWGGRHLPNGRELEVHSVKRRRRTDILCQRKSSQRRQTKTACMRRRRPRL